MSSCSSNEFEASPWICHVCDYKSSSTESRVCSVCFRTTCPLHLQRVSVYDRDSGLYVLADVCIACAAS